MQALILADGAFPTRKNRLRLLQLTPHLICCDGSVQKLTEVGLEPEAILGDLDSISPELKSRFADKLFYDPDQETNDLTKAVAYCLSKGYDELAILGATGLREDHTLGNIALLADYAVKLKSVCLLTDYGRIDAVCAGYSTDQFMGTIQDSMAPEISMTRDGQYTVARFSGFPGQQVSFFALDPTARLSLMGLRYPLTEHRLTSWWQGTLNEATGDTFSVSIDKGSLIVYRLDDLSLD